MSNKIDVQEIVIDGETYVRKSSVLPKQTHENIVIARSYGAGVFMGELYSADGKEVVLKNARRLWKWAGAASLSQLAMEGVKRPNGCKFPCPVTSVTLTDVVEIIRCTDAAIKSVAEVPIWTA